MAGDKKASPKTLIQGGSGVVRRCWRWGGLQGSALRLTRPFPPAVKCKV
mgnify:CR=1